MTGTVDDQIITDWPRSIGFFGAIGAAVALDLISMPIAVFVAAVPFLMLMTRDNAARPPRFDQPRGGGVPEQRVGVVTAANGLRPLLTRRVRPASKGAA